MASAQQRLDQTFGALADPTRRAILARLTEGETTVNELVGASGLSQPTISKHLKVLERAGLVSRRQEAQWRYCRLEAEPLRLAGLWIDRYRRFWQGNFDRLETYIEQIQANERREASTRQTESKRSQEEDKS